MKNYPSIEQSPRQKGKLKVDSYQYQSKNGEDTFNSPTDSERYPNDFCELSKSAFTFGSKKSKYTSSSKLTKSRLFSIMGKGKNDLKIKGEQKNEEISLLKDSLSNLTNSKLSIAYKIKKDVSLGINQLDKFISLLE